MKRFLIAAFFVFIAGTAWGHPASSLELEYSPDYGTLAITANHSVKDPTDHYIVEYVIEVDGKEVQRLEEKRQTDATKSGASVSLPGLKKGTVIKVTSRCNKFGEKSVSLTLQ